MQTGGGEFPKLKPFLKWAGSKRKLLNQLAPLVPDQMGKYFEPFLGGGSLFFAISPESAEISDASGALIETYKAVKRDVERVLRFIRPLELNREEFERIKNATFRTAGNRAGAFIYLNKACWNGLYRVNSKGKFNVPFGWPRSDFIVDSKQLRDCSKQLRRRAISIKKQDFGCIEPRVRSGDFVFLDPPYVTAHNFNGFVDWNERLFRWDDQVRLSELALRLVQRGANVLVTNADHPSVIDLYREFGFRRITRQSTLASNATKRKITTEGLFFAGPFYRSKRDIKQKVIDGSKCRVGRAPSDSAEP